MRTSTRVGRRRRRAFPAVLAVALLVAPVAQARHQMTPGAGTTPPTETPVVVESSDSFDWGDAGVGAGTAIGVALVGGAAAATLVRRRRGAGRPLGHHETKENAMTTINEPVAVDEEKLMAFVLSAVEEVGATVNTALVVMGDRLGLYRALAGARPTSPKSWSSAASEQATSANG